MKTVRLLGTAKNLAELPAHEAGIEVWCENNPARYDFVPRALVEFTRWWNLHSRAWMNTNYPRGVRWYRQQTRPDRPLYTQRYWPDIPGSTVFERDVLQTQFATAAGPNRYFTCTLAWQLALAIHERFEAIELWGHMLSLRYRDQRPCVFYWIEQARARGIEVRYQRAIEKLPQIAGDPDTYTGPLYGYETKPEPAMPSTGRRLTSV